MAKPGLPKKYAKMGFKKGWRAFKAAKRQRSPAGKRRRAAGIRRVRRATHRSHNTHTRRNMNRKGLPHPSITGLASLALLGGWINSKSGWVHTQPSKDSVTGWLMAGNIEKAGIRLSENLKSAVTTPEGRKAVVGSVAIAAGGAILRKHIPRVKIGTQKTYLTI